MKVLVTGATGLVGRQLCTRLLEKGHQLVAVGRSNEAQFRKKFSLNCEYQNWESLDVGDIEAIFHLAGEPIAGLRWTQEKKAKILSSRTETTEKLVAAFSGRWPKVFIGASAIGYYGDRDSEELTEKSSPGTGFLAEVCQRWELSSKEFDQHSRVVRLRIGLVLDSKGGFLKAQRPLFSLGLGGPVAGGRQWMSWIHIEDLIEVLLYALEEPIAGTFNAVSPGPVTNAEWTKAFAEQLKRPAIIPAPKWGLKLALGEMSRLALDSQKVSSDKIINEGFQFKFSELKAALDQL